MTPKVRASLDFVAGYLGTDRDHRVAGCAAYECLEELSGTKNKPTTPAAS